MTTSRPAVGASRPRSSANDAGARIVPAAGCSRVASDEAWTVPGAVRRVGGPAAGGRAWQGGGVGRLGRCVPWDRIAYPPRERAVADPWVALSVIASVTETLRLGPMVTLLARRRVQKLARETVTLDHLSNGR